MKKQAKAAVGDTKVNEVTAVPTPAPTELNVNLCDGGDFRIMEEFLINYTDLGPK